MRIVSLLPSITEIVVALGKQNQLVGRSHECDYPEEITSLPACTEPKFNTDGSSYEIDQRVKALVQEGLSVYRVDIQQLKKLDPDIILTQDHCDVCAATADEVKQAVKEHLGEQVAVLSVSPNDLSTVVDSIRTIAQAIGAEQEGQQLMQQMKSELQNIQQQVLELRRPKVLAIEWLDPLMVGGNWIPELVQLAGGWPVAAEAGEHSPCMEWEDMRQLEPDIITIMPCGFEISETMAEISTLTEKPGWQDLRAVKNKQVFVMDGNHYFNRPGPRLVDSTRILAEVIHPSIFRTRYPSTGWIDLWRHNFQQKLQLS
jgi:iron complex transport system substrate-binding protein